MVQEKDTQEDIMSRDKPTAGESGYANGGNKEISGTGSTNTDNKKRNSQR